MDIMLHNYLFLFLFGLGICRAQDCNSSSIGLQDTDGIPYYNFQASSYSPSSFQKELNKDGGEVWCPNPNKTNGSYLEVDLGSRYSLCAVSVQGSSNGHATQFNLSLSLDRITWTSLTKNTSEMTFLGNSGAFDVVRHNFSSLLVARFVRFYPILYKDQACMKVELYGEESAKESCDKSPFGILSGNIPNIKINSSLHRIVNFTGNSISWCAQRNSTGSHLQIDLGSYSVVCAVRSPKTTFGRKTTSTKYLLNFSMDGINWTQYTQHNIVEVLDDLDDKVFTQRILCRYIRFIPLGNSSCFSMPEIYGYSSEVLLNEDVGLKYGNKNHRKYLPDQSLATSKGQFDYNYPPSAGRLYTPMTSWCPNDPASPQYIELILVEKYFIFAVSIQGFWEAFDVYYFAAQYNVSYSDNYQDWRKYPLQNYLNVTLDNVIDKHVLERPIEARILRLEIPPSNSYSCLRVELHGISAVKSEFCTKQYPLGMSDQGTATIKDQSITASSYYGRSYRSNFARLRNERCWCATYHKGQHINIDFGKMVTITGVATQGCISGYVTKYQIKYSYDGLIWYDYVYHNITETFQGNSALQGEDGIFANWLNTFVITKYIRITVLEYDTRPCLRLELYGCTDAVGTPVITKYTTSATLNRTKNNKIVLTCVVQGQPGMVVTWARNRQLLQNSTFEKSITVYPSHNKTSGIVQSNLTISYHSDKDIYNNFNCVKSNQSSRILICSSVYKCSASYPGATIMSQTGIVTVTPNIIFPDVPGKPWVYNTKSQSAVISWKAPRDHQESRIEAYVIYLSDESGNVTKELYITSGLNNKTLAVSLTDLSEFTMYHAKVAAVNAITKSNFTEHVSFLTLLRATVSVNQPDNLKVMENQRNVSIICTGISYPTPYVTWKRYGTELTRINSTETANNSTIYQLVVESKRDNKTRSSLEVTSTLFLRPAGIYFQDYGNYMCEVLNENESNVSVTKGVNILFPPRLQEKPRSRIIFEGDNISLNCRAEGSPPPVITWDLVGEGVTLKNTTDKNASLLLTNIRSTGRYNFLVTCRATSKGGETKANAVIEIYVRPRIINLTKSFTAIAFNNITLKCDILANPSPQVWWTKDGNVLHVDNIGFKNGNKTLIITGAAPYNVGNYSCFARNNLSAIDKRLHLNLKRLPKANILDKDGIIRKLILMKRQKNVRISCLGYGYPKLRVTWKLNGSNIPESISGRNDVHQTSWHFNINGYRWIYSVLYFNQSGAQFKDFGNYTCEVSIELAAKHIDAEILEILFYPVVNAGPSDVTAFEGSEAIFNCEVDGKPDPSTSWLFQNETISANHSVLSNGSLILYSVRKTEEGTYSCFAKNKAGQSNISSAVLTVRVTPALVVSITGGGIYRLNSNLTLTCHVEGRPMPYVNWRKVNDNTNPLNNLPNFILENGNRTLLIRNASLNDSGTYVCKASNKYSKDERNTTVSVGEPPRISQIYSNPSNNALVGKPAALVCVAEGIPRPKITWIKGSNETPKYNVLHHQSINEYGVKSTMIILSTTFSDSGNYSCQATNGHGITIARIVLDIYALPGIFVIPTQPVGVENNYVVLSCRGGDKQNLTYSWLKENRIVNVRRPRYTLLANGSLEINPVLRNDDGQYSCKVSRGGKSRESKQVNLTVWYLNDPKWLGHYIIYEGENITISCNGDGKPDPTFTWYLLGQKITSITAIVQNDGMLFLHNVTMKNNGQYSCNASNEVKSAYRPVAYISVKNFPTLKVWSSLVQVKEGVNFSLRCSYEDVIGFAKISNLHWIKDGKPLVTSSSNRYKVISIDQLLIANSSVKDSGKYQCKGTLGEVSKLSSFVDVTVFLPSGPVILESTPETSTTGIKLAWKPIPKIFWDGQKITFRISVFQNNHSVKVVYTARTDVIIAGLQPDTSYTVVLSGSTHFGEIPHAIVKATTKPNTNNKRYELDVKLTDVEFSKYLEDPSSGRYEELKSSLEQSVDIIYKQSNIGFQYIKSTITGFRKGSVIAKIVIWFDTKFSQPPSIVVKELNKARTIAGHTFDKLFTEVKDFDECKNEIWNSCHEYANCTNIVGSYICKCFEGFFGDGEKCKGPAKIIGKSAANVTQLVETNVTLICKVIGYPTPVITWMRRSEDGERIQIKRTTDKDDGDYHLLDASTEHSGDYICIASNILGYQSYETHLTINPVIVDIDVEIQLSNETFKEELKNKSSPVYKKLEKNVYNELYKFFNNTPGFDDIQILGFVKGSIKVVFRVVLKVKKPSKNTNDVIAIRVGKKLNNQLKKGRIGNILVVPEVIKLKVRPPPPVNVTYSDVKEDTMHIYWDPPELYEMFSIERYYIRYRKRGEKSWNNNSIHAQLSTNGPMRNLESNSFYSVQIFAENVYGMSRRSRTVEVKTMKIEVLSLWYYVAPIICILVIGLLVIVVLLYRRFTLNGSEHIGRKRDKSHEKQTKASFQMIVRNRRNENVYENKAISETEGKPCWNEIPRSSVQLIQRTVEPGDFGIVVVEGKVLRPIGNTTEPCAVKMLKDDFNEEDVNDLMEELRNISEVGKHNNIVNLIGACTRDENPLIILELCSNGTLDNYLKENRENQDVNYAVEALSARVKMRLANEIAQGMNHLADAKVVHRDLAAKNVLLTGDLTAKISNFGLARDIYERGTYQEANGGKLQARWMALESLTDGSYTLKSDVWSYGIVLWEIETGAMMPYQELEVAKLIEHLRRSYRLQKPEKCPDRIYDLMLQCWKVKPHDRPDFNEIVAITESYLADEKNFVNVPLGS